MENASKALIIAGAILLAIVIISLGLIVVNNTRNTVDTANLNEQEIQAFNAKFASYEGQNVSGSMVNSLLQQIIATNQDIADKGENHFVGVAYPSISQNGTSKPYVFMACNPTNGVQFGYNAYSDVPPDVDCDDSVTDATKSVVAIRNVFRSQIRDKKYATQVNKNGNYKVTLTYHSGLVAGITVKIN